MLALAILGFVLAIKYANADEQTRFIERVHRAQQQCLSQYYDPVNPEITQVPSEQKSDYAPSRIQNTLFPVQLQLYRFCCLDESKENFYLSKLTQLGVEARAFAEKEKLELLEYPCLVGCMTSQLMDFDNKVKNPMLYVALSQGKGKCTHFSQASKLLLDIMGLKTSVTNSFRHSFLTILLKQEPHYYFEPQQDGRVSCNYFPIDQSL